jgi:hypothetical protein
MCKMKNNGISIQSFFVGVALFLSSTLFGKVLLFDMADVLFSPSKIGIWKELGYINTSLYYTIDGRRPNDLQRTTFGMLALFNNRYKNEVQVFSPDGFLLPNIMCSWLAGELSNKQIFNEAHGAITEYGNQNRFKNTREKDLVENLVNIIFSARLFAANTLPVSGMSKILKKCTQGIDKQEKRKHRLFVYANWDKESFEVLCSSPHAQEIFHYFRDGGIYISGQTGLLLPQERAFRHFFEKYNIRAEDCILISAQSGIVTAARAHGMQAILVSLGNMRSLSEQLVQCNVINS